MSTLALKNVRLATMNPAIKGAAYGLIEDATIVINNKEIRWCGPTADLPNTFHSQQTCDFAGRLVTPALIDCHSHLIFGGNRAREFELRLKGLSYEDIARQGGGIKETVRMTRDASDQDLLTQALTRVDSLINEGVADIEIKSGYGLNIDDELRMLRVARHIETKRQVDIHTSFLGAHALPPEYNKRPEAYLVEVCLPALEAAHNQGLVDAVDGFCENIAFSTEQISRVFDCAKRLGLPVKLHAEQLSLSGAAALAASYQALSADHLEYIDENGVRALAKAGTVAVLLPGAFYSLGETQKPPIHLLRQHGVAMAVATDCNPGSSPLHSILLAANMACTLFRLTPEEALAGITREAAKALGLNNKGIIKAGYQANLCIWDVNHPAELSYNIGLNPLYKRVFNGNIY